VAAAPDLYGKITTAAGKAGMPYIMPNAYGFPPASTPRPDNIFTKFSVDRIADITGNGVSTAVTISYGFWYKWSLALGNEWFGSEIRDRKVTFFDDGLRTITTSTWDQCGRALAALLSLPETSQSAP
jgi:hypothetical protein